MHSPASQSRLLLFPETRPGTEESARADQSPRPRIRRYRLARLGAPADMSAGAAGRPGFEHLKRSYD